MKKKPEIISIEKMFDNATCEYYYQIIITFDDIPNLKIGECEVTQ